LKDGSVIFHPLIQRDLNGILRYYNEEAGPMVADRFFETLINLANQAVLEPKKFHPFATNLRRANIAGFPYHFLFRETHDGIRVLVFRHDRRHPSFGLRRT
jgi:plasmid stabilization system protein ParE